MSLLIKFWYEITCKEGVPLSPQGPFIATGMVRNSFINFFDNYSTKKQMLIEIFKNWKKLNDIIMLICLESRKMEEIEKYQYIIAVLKANGFFQRGVPSFNQIKAYLKKEKKTTDDVLNAIYDSNVIEKCRSFNNWNLVCKWTFTSCNWSTR